MFEGRREVGEGLVEVVAEDESVELGEARAFRFELLAVDVLYPHVCDAANDNKQQLEKKLRDGKGRGERGEGRGERGEGRGERGEGRGAMREEGRGFILGGFADVLEEIGTVDLQSRWIIVSQLKSYLTSCIHS